MCDFGHLQEQEYVYGRFAPPIRPQSINPEETPRIAQLQ
jgi:hypothetical protein